MYNRTTVRTGTTIIYTIAYILEHDKISVSSVMILMLSVQFAPKSLNVETATGCMRVRQVRYLIYCLICRRRQWGGDPRFESTSVTLFVLLTGERVVLARLMGCRVAPKLDEQYGVSKLGGSSCHEWDDLGSIIPTMIRPSTKDLTEILPMRS